MEQVNGALRTKLQLSSAADNFISTFILETTNSSVKPWHLSNEALVI